MEHAEEPLPKVSPYRRLDRLGAGGMGEVYVGVDETLKRRGVAIAFHPEQRLQASWHARAVSTFEHKGKSYVLAFSAGSAGHRELHGARADPARRAARPQK